MKSKRLWAFVIGSVLTAFLFVACGGGSSATSVPAAAATRVPTPTPTPVAQTGDEAEVASATGYTWSIETVDDNASKP